MDRARIEVTKQPVVHIPRPNCFGYFDPTPDKENPCHSQCLIWRSCKARWANISPTTEVIYKPVSRELYSLEPRGGVVGN